MKATYQGVEVEFDLRPGFTVHNQDGTSSLLMHLENFRIVGGWPTPPGGGEPLPEPKSA